MLLDWISHGALRLFGVEDGSRQRIASREGSSGRLNTSTDEDEIYPGEFEELRERFEQDSRPISRIMVPRDSVHFLDVARDPDENLTGVLR